MTKLDFVDQAKIALNEELSNTGYTNGYIMQRLHENNKTFVDLMGEKKVVELTAYDISEGKGYCSRVFKTTVHFEEDTKDTYTFILKVPTDDAWNEMNVDFSEADKENNKETIRKMHNAECDAYDLIKGLKDFPAPEIYYLDRATVKQSGMIMMNDLSKRGGSLGVFFSVTQQQCFNLAKHMVDFQAYVDFLPEQPWRGKFTENMHAKADMEEIWMKMILPILDYDGDKELHPKVKNLLTLDVLPLGEYATETCARDIGCTTLVHGDMWTNNMLIELGPDGSVSDQILAIIDWQTFFEGSPLFDLARFMSNCADAEVRRECEYKVIDFYYDYLTKKYKEHDAKPKFTREQAHTMYELGLVQQTVLMAIMFALIGLPLKDSKKGADQARLRKLALRLHLLYDDCITVMDKHGLQEKFQKKK